MTVEQPAGRNDQAAQQGRPEALHRKVQAKRLGHAARQHQHASVDQQGEQTQCKNDQRQGKQLKQWAHERI
jgi:hypothetical protein